MSIEAAVLQLAESVAALAAAVNGGNGAEINDSAIAPEGKRRGRPPKSETAAPIAPTAPAPVAMGDPPFVLAAPIAPAAPAAVAPAAPVQVPFSDAQGMMQYVMSSYKEMGPEKGARIQHILVGMGKTNVAEITPDLYGSFFAQVEALKGA